MQNVRWLLQISFWMLGMLGLGLPLTWAAEGEIEYRFERMVPQLEQPWYFFRPTHIAIAPDGSVWIVDYGNNRIQHFHTNGLFIAAFGHEEHKSNVPGGLNQPNGIALAADGSVWITDTGNAQIQRIMPDGTFAAPFGQRGAKPGQLDQPQGIALAADGSLWVADTNNHRLQHFSVTGNFIAQFGSQGSGPVQFNAPGSVLLASDGTLWVADTGNHRVQHLSADGRLINQFGSKGNATGQFDTPHSIALASDGSVWVADFYNNRLQQFKADGTFIRHIVVQRGLENGQLNYPYGIASAADGSLWVSDYQNDRIQHLSAKGGFIAKFGNKGDDKAQFDYPTGITSTEDGSIWVIDRGNFRLQHLSATGEFLAQLSRRDAEVSDFGNITIAGDGSLWVVDADNYRIKHFTATGTFINQFGSKGSEKGQFNYPWKIAAAPDGSVWVVDRTNYNMQHFSAKGSFIAQLNNMTSTITVAADGSLWAAIGSHVQHFNADGSALAVPGNLGSTTSKQFQTITCIRVARDNSLWILDSGNRQLQHFTAAGEFIEQFGSLGSGSGQFINPMEFTISPNGAIWVADTNNDRIQKFIPRAKSAAAHPYKAVILAGGGENIGNRVNHIWDGTWRITQKAFKALSLQGFDPHEEIKFLTAGSTQFDLDANGRFDDLEAANKESLQRSITEWAKDAKDVVIYLADHGGPGKFQINGTEILTGEELSAWIAQLEQVIPGKVTVVIESCKSGSFFANLANLQRPRYVLASAKADQQAVVSNDGLRSFSYNFWSQVMGGAKLKDAFKDARQAMSSTIIDNQPRDAQADANGDAQYNEQDLNAMGDYCLGNCNQTAGAAPTIASLSTNKVTLNGQLTLNLKIKVQHLESLQDVWVSIQRPDDISIDPDQPLSFEKVSLECDKDECSGQYPRFDTRGEYRLSFYAMDAHYDMSAPEIMLVTQTQGNNVMSAVYDDKQTTLYLRDVTVGEQHFQAALQLDNGQFKLLTASPASGKFASPASFDAGSNVLNIPLARAFGQNYQAMLKHVGNFAFELQGAAPK